jgi:hypothetical protein
MADAAASSSFIHFEAHFRICHEPCVIVLVARSRQSPKAAFGLIVLYGIELKTNQFIFGLPPCNFHSDATLP